MRIDKITKSYGRTVNVGDFNSIRLETTIEATLEPGEDADPAGAALYEQVKNEVENDILGKLDEIQGARDDIFNHIAAQNNKYRRG
jgi:hypothetical protein